MIWLSTRRQNTLAWSQCELQCELLTQKSPLPTKMKHKVILATVSTFWKTSYSRWIPNGTHSLVFGLHVWGQNPLLSSFIFTLVTNVVTSVNVKLFTLARSQCEIHMTFHMKCHMKFILNSQMELILWCLACMCGVKTPFWVVLYSHWLQMLLPVWIPKQIPLQPTHIFGGNAPKIGEIWTKMPPPLIDNWRFHDR